jgi:hypothetical protein
MDQTLAAAVQKAGACCFGSLAALGNHIHSTSKIPEIKRYSAAAFIELALLGVLAQPCRGGCQPRIEGLAGLDSDSSESKIGSVFHVWFGTAGSPGHVERRD